MQNYLLTFLTKESLDDKARGELIESVKKSLGEIKKEDLWGVRDLSYPIEHSTKAYYAHYEFSVEPDKISNLDKSLKLNEDVIRYLIVKAKPQKKAKKGSKTS